MNELIASIAGSEDVLPKALFVTAAGLTGVFIVLAAFFFLIVFLEKAFRPKSDK